MVMDNIGKKTELQECKSEQCTIEARKMLRRKLDLLLRTGELLVESSADTSRIVRNICCK